MNIIFYIVIPGRRKYRFDSAGQLDQYIQNHNLPEGSKIILKENNNTVGEMLVVRYIELKKENDK
ncbi:MAG: hypothetical protein GYA62_05235 [Bacteroidales bacterium]|nr:hypothetical protein [Bacteroidales bacterium]